METFPPQQNVIGNRWNQGYIIHAFQGNEHELLSEHANGSVALRTIHARLNTHLVPSNAMQSISGPRVSVLLCINNNFVSYVISSNKSIYYKLFFN